MPTVEERAAMRAGLSRRYNEGRPAPARRPGPQTQPPPPVVPPEPPKTTLVEDPPPPEEAMTFAQLLEFVEDSRETGAPLSAKVVAKVAADPGEQGGPVSPVLLLWLNPPREQPPPNVLTVHDTLEVPDEAVMRGLQELADRQQQQRVARVENRRPGPTRW